MYSRIHEQQHAMTTSVNQNSDVNSTVSEELDTGTKSESMTIETHDHINREQVEEMVKTFNDFLTPSHTDLKFEFHEKLNEYYVTIVNSSTKEVVKEIPPKKMLDMYAAIAERIGLIVDQKI